VRPNTQFIVRGLRTVTRRSVPAAALVAVAVVVAACGGGGGSAAGPSAGKVTTLTIGVVPSAVPTSLDPSQTGGTENQYVFELAYAPILHIGANGTYGPALATKWGYVGTGNKEFQFTLRQDAKFSDGDPVNAAAVVTWMKYFIKAGGPFAGQLGSVASITATSQWTVDIKLSEPNPAIPWQLAQTNGLGYVASPKAVASPASMKLATDGAGPYILDPSETVPGYTYTYSPNKYFYDQSQIHFSQVILKVISNQSSMLSALESGQIQVALGDYTTAGTAKAAGYNLVTARTAWDGVLFPTLGQAGNPLNNVKVRQALSYAIDRKAITTGLLGNYGIPTSEWLTTDGFDPGFEDHYGYDPQMAKSLLASAGYGTGLTLNLLTAAGQLQDGTPGEGLAQAIAQDLQAVGVKLNVTMATGSQLTADLFSGKYQMYVSFIGINPYAVYWSLFLAPNATANFDKWTDPEVEAQYELGAVAADPAADFQAISRTLTDIAFELPIYSPESLVYATKNIGGIYFPVLSSGISPGTFPDPTQFFSK
jgi:peptide/nickel transport system substrate-binding protein